MKTINLLLGNAEARVNDLIEALVRDVCGDRAVVRCTRAGRAEDFVVQGFGEKYDLAIVVPDNLLPEKGRPVSAVMEAVRAIRRLKRRRPTPIIAAGVRPEDQDLVYQSEADHVLQLPFNCAELKSTVRGLLNLPSSPESKMPRPPGWFESLTRGWQRLWQTN